MHDSRSNLYSIVADDFAQPTAQTLHPQRFLVVAAQVLLKGDVLQPLHPLAQRMLLIGLPEKAGIVETGAEHPLVSMANDAFRVRVSVEHGQEMRQQFAGHVFGGKVFLMVPHDCD